MQKTGKVILTLAVALSGIVSTMVDLLPGDSGHVFNPTWSKHAVFHDIVMFLFLDFMAIACIWALWRKSTDVKVGAKLSLLLVVGFWTPFYYITTFFPQASLAAANEGTPAYAAELKAVTLGTIGGLPVYINVSIGSVMILLSLIGYYLFSKGLRANK